MIESARNPGATDRWVVTPRLFEVGDNQTPSAGTMGNPQLSRLRTKLKMSLISLPFFRSRMMFRRRLLTRPEASLVALFFCLSESGIEVVGTLHKAPQKRIRLSRREIDETLRASHEILRPIGLPAAQSLDHAAEPFLCRRRWHRFLCLLRKDKSGIDGEDGYVGNVGFSDLGRNLFDDPGLSQFAGAIRGKVSRQIARGDRENITIRPPVPLDHSGENVALKQDRRGCAPLLSTINPAHPLPKRPGNSVVVDEERERSEPGLHLIDGGFEIDFLSNIANDRKCATSRIAAMLGDLFDLIFAADDIGYRGTLGCQTMATALPNPFPAPVIKATSPCSARFRTIH